MSQDARASAAAAAPINQIAAQECVDLHHLLHASHPNTDTNKRVIATLPKVRHGMHLSLPLLLSHTTRMKLAGLARTLFTAFLSSFLLLFFSLS